MAFEIIECVNPPAVSKSAVPPKGVLVRSRMLTIAPSRGGGQRRYIKLSIGSILAKSLSLTQPEQSVLLLFGTDSDAGMVRVCVPHQGGPFRAKRDKKGNYALTINAATADGLFALNFPEFTVDNCEALRPSNGQSPHFVFRATAEMLKAED